MVAYSIAILGGIVAVLGYVVLAALVRSWALTLLWAWFVADPFGLPYISLPLAMGLCLLAGMFTASLARQKSEHVWVDAAGVFLGPVLAVGMGWLVRQWL